MIDRKSTLWMLWVTTILCIVAAAGFGWLAVFIDKTFEPMSKWDVLTNTAMIVYLDIGIAVLLAYAVSGWLKAWLEGDLDKEKDEDDDWEQEDQEEEQNAYMENHGRRNGACLPARRLGCRRADHDLRHSRGRSRRRLVQSSGGVRRRRNPGRRYHHHRIG